MKFWGCFLTIRVKYIKLLSFLITINFEHLPMDSEG
jgi:hypothetical protein